MVAVIIINWNGYRDTIECLESLLRLEAEDFCIVIVDNMSGDGSKAQITNWSSGLSTQAFDAEVWSRLPRGRRYKPKLTSIEMAKFSTRDDKVVEIIWIDAKDNLGYAGGNNLAMKTLEDNDVIDYFWLLNNDTVVDPKCLDFLLRAESDAVGIGIFGSCLVYYENPDILQSVCGVFSKIRCRGWHLGAGSRLKDIQNYKDYGQCLSYISGASIFFKKEVYRVLGPMSEDYFLYFEELDWAQRLKGKGWQKVVLDAIVYHKEGSSIGSKSIGRPSDKSLYFMHRSLIRYMWRWHPTYIAFAFGRVFRYAASFLRSRDFRAVTVLIAATLDSIAGKEPRSRY